ncbi:MAG: transketolase [Alicyclobacillus sp.]|nr:transketolase [Alicyclobacillus sp.]
MTELSSVELADFARRIRRQILLQIFQAGSGHPGGSLSCADILAVTYGYAVNPPPDWSSRPDRDRVILSKGHAAPALYATMAEMGFIPVEELSTLRQLGSRLQGHPDRTRLPEVEISTGSLGQGLSVGVGLAWWYRVCGHSGHIYVILGDGELNEGQIWEAISLAGYQHLHNLIAIVDANGLQNDGSIAEILDLRPYSPKITSFGWSVQEVDGHHIGDLMKAIDWAKSDAPGPRPRCIIAHTVKGKGVSFMENRPEWHSHGLSPMEYEQALKEVGI